jgi:heat shock protein HslJ
MVVRGLLAGAFALLAAGAIADPARLQGPEWRVVEIGGQVVPSNARVTMSFLPEGRIAGSSGCNRFTGGVTLAGATISVGAVAGTRMACPPPLMDLEARFLAVLQQAESWTLDGSGRLTVTGKDGRAIVASR